MEIPFLIGFYHNYNINLNPVLLSKYIDNHSPIAKYTTTMLTISVLVIIIQKKIFIFSQKKPKRQKSTQNT